MHVPRVAVAVETLASSLRRGDRVLVLGPASGEARARLLERGFATTEDANAAGALACGASALGPVVEVFADLADRLSPGAFVVASDLMWATAPTPELVAAFPSTRPMEGYEMQAEASGFEVVRRVDAGREAFEGAPLAAAARRALDEDARGAALWRILLARRVE